MVTNNLMPWVVLNQHTDPTADGGGMGGEDADHQCGAAAAAEVILNQRGVRIPIDTVKDEIIGQNTVSIISVAQLRAWFSTWCRHLPTSLRTPAPTQDALVALVKQYVDARRPLIELRYFQFPGNTLLHFVVVIDYDDARIYYANSWTGTIDSETYAEHTAMSRFQLIGIDQGRSPQL